MGFLKSLFQRQLVGLDIGVSGIKAVELSGSKNPRLVAYNRMPLPWEAITRDGEIKDRGHIVSALRKLFEFRAFTTKRVALGIGGNSVITKKITVPQMSVAELNNQLYWEAEQYIPFSMADVNIDFAVIGNNIQNSSGSPMMDVLLVAAKKEYIQLIRGIVEEAGLSPDLIDNQAFALGNAFEFNYSHSVGKQVGTTSVIIDFGAGTTKVSVVDGDKTTFTRDLRQSGIACTQIISERLAMSLEDAERAKLTDTGNPSVRNIIAEFVHQMVEEISRTIDYSLSQGSDRVVQGVYICGGASLTVGLREALEAKLPAPISVLNPIQNIVGSGRKMNADAIRELSYLGAVAIGLSLRKVGDNV